MITQVDKSLVGRKVKYVGNQYTEFGFRCCPEENVNGRVTNVCGGNIEVQWPEWTALNHGTFWYYPNELSIVG